MTLHRQSALFWWLLAAATLAYLKQNGNPVEWGFDQWIDAGIAAAAWRIGKYQSSPLPGKDA